MAGKADRLMAGVGAANMAESIGRGVPRAAAPSNNSTAPARYAGVKPARDASLMPVEKIDRDPNQPRVEFDEAALGRLAESLKARGQLQPIRVRWDEGRGLYTIVCGERRWRAAKMAGLSTVSAIVADGPVDPDQLLEDQLVENCLREDLKPVEQARAYRQLQERYGLSIRQLADRLNLEFTGVGKCLSLLGLPPEVRDQIDGGRLSPTTAHEIAKLDSPEEQAELAREAITAGLTGAVVKDRVRARKDPGSARRKVEWAHRVTGVRITVLVPANLGEEGVDAALRAMLGERRKARADAA